MSRVQENYGVCVIYQTEVEAEVTAWEDLKAKIDALVDRPEYENISAMTVP